MVVGEIKAAWAAQRRRSGGPARGRGPLLDLVLGPKRRLATVFRTGTGDADIADEWSKRQGARRDLFAHMLAAWPDSAFRAGLSRERATDILWALATDEVFHLFVRERGWTPTAFEAWLLAALRREILASPA